MDINQLKGMGLMASNPLVKREIAVRYRPLLPKNKWADPDIEERADEELEERITFWLRKLTAADQVAISLAVKRNRDPFYTILHRSVYKEDGSRVFETEDDAIGLNIKMFTGLIDEINKLNGDLTKKSMPRTRSGAKSRSPSAAAASRNGRTPSAPLSSPSGVSTESGSVP